MRFVIYGAGGIGGTIGARLHLAGYPVELIARGEHGQMLQQRGLHFISPSQDSILQIPTSLSPQELAWQADDVVLLCMKSQHTLGALDDLRAAGAGHLPIVCAQNGVANEAMALRRCPRVYGMLVFLPSWHVEPGQVVTNAEGAGGVLDTGCYPTGSDNTAHQLTAALTQAGFSAEPDVAVMRKKYGKLVTNTVNALSALTDMATGSMEIAEALKAEALACYAAAGIDCASKAEMSARYSLMNSVALDAFPRSGGSTWQSVLRGTGNIEVDYLNGEIVQLGRRFGVPTPANAACQNLALALARRGGKPGSVSVAQLRAAMASS